MKKAERLENAVSNQSIEAYKRKDLAECRKTLDDDSPLVTRYNQGDDQPKNHMDTVVTVGTKNWQNIRDEIRRLRTDLGNA